MIYKKLLFAFSLIFTQANMLFAQMQNNDSVFQKKMARYFEVGIGLPSVTIRDRVTTSNAYSGTGLAAFHLANSKQNGWNWFREFRFNTNLMNAQPDIENLTDWNKSASIFTYGFTYRKLKGTRVNSTKKWHFFAGGSLSSNGQVAIIPAVNNSMAYNFNWLQACAEGMVQRNFNFKKKKFQFIYQVSLPIAGVTVRPLSYIGLPPAAALWNQFDSDLNILFAYPKFSSLHNNFMFANAINVDMHFSRSKLRLQYNWQYIYNTVSINSLHSIVSSVNVAYLVKLKK